MQLVEGVTNSQPSSNYCGVSSYKFQREPRFRKLFAAPLEIFVFPKEIARSRFASYLQYFDCGLSNIRKASVMNSMNTAINYILKYNKLCLQYNKFHLE